MAEDNDGELLAQWHRLHAEQIELRNRIEETLDPDERAALVAQLDTNQEQSLEIERGLGGPGPSPAGPPRPAGSEQAGGWFAGDATTTGNVGVPPPAHREGSNVDELLSSLGVDTAGVEAKQAAAAQSDQSLKLAVSLPSVLAAGAAGMAMLIAIGALLWLLATNGDDETATDAGNQIAAQDVQQSSSQSDTAAPQATTPETTPSSAPGFQEAVPPSSDRDAALQSEVDRITASTPLIFPRGSSGLDELQLRILNNVASAVLAYPDLPVTVVGYTDADGDEETNRQLSLARAGAVQNYLVSQGVPDDRLTVDARGEESASGSDTLAGLERRVEFEIGKSANAPVAPNADPLRIAVVAPSGRDDLAFTQSMVDAVNVIAAERGNVEVEITDNTFVPDEAAAAIRGYAGQEYDLIIAHGVEFGGALLDIVREHPNVTFAWGTAIETFGLPNLYAYDAAAEEGGYVMGAMSTMLSSTKTVGVVGPIEVGDAARYVNGFAAGARDQEPQTNVLVEYTGSFADITLAAEFAQTHVSSGADVLTGSAEMVVGAVSVANENGVLWFGTQARQDSLAPEIVVASQVYHWEVVLRPIVTDIDAGTKNGRAHIAHLSNGGLVIEYNPEFDLPAAVRQRADQLTGEISSGALTVPVAG
ncbi:MAG: BMP family ABC transporter substrate-binding protein [Acidimicrobiales bacterium]